MLLKSDLRLVVSTYAGLEELLSKELRQLGGRDVEIHTRAVSCIGDLGFVYKVNFSSRLALRVMISLTSFPIKDGDDLYEQVLKLDWTELMKVNQTFSVRCTLNSDLFDNNLYPALKVKDAIADCFRKETGKRPDVSKTDSDLEVNVFINKNKCTLLINSSGDSLHRRGYRVDVDKAPLSEVLAAGIIMLSGWEPHKPLVDFMCGSGTIPIEAALMSANIPPGIFRKKFAFEKWLNFDEALYKTIREKQLERINEQPVRIYGNEINKYTLEKAKENVVSAGVEDMVELSLGDFRDLERPQGNGVIIINPPYGEKLQVEDIEALYKEIGDKFKKSYAGYKAWIFTGSPEGAKSVGLRANRKIALFNGPIDCRLLGYELFEGSKKDLYQNKE